MPYLSRRAFLAGTAGFLASDLAAQAEAPLAEDTMPESVGKLPAFDQSGTFSVDAFGAVGDCPTSGSTAGAVDDSQAIAKAFNACPDGGIVRFSPGRCYMVSRPIQIVGKQINIDARGAIVRCRDDSVWHVFTIGGTSEAVVEEVNVWGGLWDGNRANQRYYPNTDGKTVFTDLGQEPFGQHVGTPFYENSRINGIAWNNGWIKGSAPDGIDVNGNGNDGLIRIQYAKRANFHACTAKDWVRNAFVAWGCRQNLFFNMQGAGQLPTNYHELNALFELSHEAAFLKTGGSNPDGLALLGDYFESVRVIGGRCDGGVMPLFCRTNRPKPEAAANHVVIEGFEAYGFSRDVWFEVASSIRIARSQIVGVSFPDSSHRHTAGVFIGNGAVDWSITDSHVRGHIDTRQKQNVRLGTLRNVTLDCDSAIPKWVVACNTISGSIIRSRGFGAFCDNAENVDTCAEAGQSLAVTGSARNCRIGQDRRDGKTGRFALSPGQSFIETGPIGGIDLLRRSNPAIQGGRWYDIHKSDYTFADGRLVFDRAAQAGDIVEIGYFERLDETLPTQAGQVAFRLPRPGGTRAADILSVALDGQDVPARRDVDDPEKQPHYTLAARPDGHGDVILRNLEVGDSGNLRVVYLPPLKPYAGLMLKPEPGGHARAEVTGHNITGIRIAGDATLSGQFSDLSEDAAIGIDHGVRAELLNLTIRRARGGILAGTGAKAQPDTLRMISCLFQDWGMGGDVTGDGRNLRAIGQNAKSGLQVQTLLQMQGTVWMRSGQEPTASADTGRFANRPVETAVLAQNTYSGVAAPKIRATTLNRP